MYFVTLIIGEISMRKIVKGAKALIIKEGVIEDEFLVLIKPNERNDLPGGKKKRIESIEECFIREIAEETGLKAII